MSGLPEKIGLVIRCGPGQGRSSRDQLDMALAAAGLGLEMDLFFMGEGTLQLLAEKEPLAADLPGGARGWKALPGITSTNAWFSGSSPEARLCAGRELLLDARVVDSDEFSRRLRSCALVLVT